MPEHLPDSTAFDQQGFFRVAEALSEDSRRDIVADIVAHPKGMPCMKELEFTTGLHRATILQHLDELVDADLVKIVEFPVGERSRGKPSKFYSLTDSARELFEVNNIFQSEHWEDLYTRVDKPREIADAEAADRPIP